MLGVNVMGVFSGLHHSILMNFLHLELSGSPSPYLNEDRGQRNTRKAEEQSTAVWTYLKVTNVRECVLGIHAVSFGMIC